MESSVLFQSFMVFYLLEIPVLVIFGYMMSREYHKEEQQQASQSVGPKGPSASDLIKMRAIARELQRQG